MKNKRIYTLFKLQDGDEIPLLFRSEKSLKDFNNEHKKYKMIKKSDVPLRFELKNIPETRSDLERLISFFEEKYGATYE